MNGNVGQSFNFGRALQADNTYGDRNTKNTNFSLSTSIPLFTGLRIPNNIALSKLNLKAATEDLNKAKEDISISVTSAYLQILFNEELAKVAHNQVELSREQLELKEAYFKNGKASEAEVYEARARVAQDEMSPRNSTKVWIRRKWRHALSRTASPIPYLCKSCPQD